MRGPTSEVLVNFVDRKQEKTIEKGQGANLVGCRLAVEPQPTKLAHHPVCSQLRWLLPLSKAAATFLGWCQEVAAGANEVGTGCSLLLWSFLVAKKSMIEREKKRLSLAHKFFQKRNEFKKQMSSTKSFKEQLFFSVKLQKLPKNSSITRLHNRCFVTGRPKGYFRDFGISRHVLREMAHQCLLPGITKASW